jgi:hypothetical protein
MLDVAKLVEEIAGSISQEIDAGNFASVSDEKDRFLAVMGKIQRQAYEAHDISDEEFGEALRQMPEMLNEPTEKDLLIASLTRAFYQCLAKRVWTSIRDTTEAQTEHPAPDDLG